MSHCIWLSVFINQGQEASGKGRTEGGRYLKRDIKSSMGTEEQLGCLTVQKNKDIFYLGGIIEGDKNRWVHRLLWCWRNGGKF